MLISHDYSCHFMKCYIMTYLMTEWHNLPLNLHGTHVLLFYCFFFTCTRDGLPVWITVFSDPYGIDDVFSQNCHLPVLLLKFWLWHILCTVKVSHCFWHFKGMYEMYTIGLSSHSAQVKGFFFSLSCLAGFSMLVTSVGMFGIPFCKQALVLTGLMSSIGMSMGILDTGRKYTSE